MSGSRNGIKSLKWPPTRDDVVVYLRRFRKRIESTGPISVREAARRIDMSLVRDQDPRSEDLASVMIWLLTIQEGRRKKPGGSKKTKPRPSPHPRPRRSTPRQTGFSVHIQEQDAADTSRIRKKLRVGRSRVRSDSSGRRIIIKGDSTE